MKDAKDLIPWKVTDISLRPFDGFWSFNPSIHFDGTSWRCVLRCCDYAMPNGLTIRSKTARPTGQLTKNAMVIFDHKTWAPIQIYKMHERDELPRASTPHVGYEDMRLFQTDSGGLQGIAASLHLRRDARPMTAAAAATEVMPQHQPPEQVLLSFDGEYNIVEAHPIRGDGWSSTPQKNWVPFDGCAEPRFLYSINKGTMFDDRGSVHGMKAVVKPSTAARPLNASTSPRLAATPETDPQLEQPREPDRPARKRHPDLRTMIRGGSDVKIIRGGKMKLDAMTSRPSSRPSLTKAAGARGGNDSTRLLGTRALRPSYDGLRGGTQLVRVGDDAWLGIGHEMKWVTNLKWYWHTWYVVDSRGSMTAASGPMKLASNGIEFAAGLAIDGDRVVVSFGVDDMECKIGETKLSAVLETLQPVER